MHMYIYMYMYVYIHICVCVCVCVCACVCVCVSLPICMPLAGLPLSAWQKLDQRWLKGVGVYIYMYL